MILLIWKEMREDLSTSYLRREMTMMMSKETVSKETMVDYYNRNRELFSMFRDNLKRAEAEMVVEGSPVDYAAHQFIRSIHNCEFRVLRLTVQISCARALARDDAEKRELIKEFHSLEVELASQNEYLDKHASMQTAHAQ